MKNIFICHKLNPLLLGIIISLPFNVLATANCPSGTTEGTDCWSCGNNCTAYITNLTDDTGQPKTFSNGSPQQKLTITGTGKMTNYSLTQDTSYGHDYGSTAPWDKYFNTVKEIDVSGVENISTGAFRHFFQTTDITVSDSVTSISTGSFDYLPKLTNLRMSSNLSQINSAAFQYTPLHSFVLPDSVTFIGDNAFRSASFADFYCTEDKMDLCKQALKNSGFTDVQINKKLQSYKDVGGQYLYNNKFYKSPNDILNGSYLKKRIYTVREANQVSKKTGNTIKIRYK